MCANEEPLRYNTEQNIHVARNLYTLSSDKIIDLILAYNLMRCTTSVWCLRHTILVYDRLLHNCDVKTIIYYFLNMVVTQNYDLSFFMNTGWETVFYRTFTVKVYYNRDLIV